MSWKQTQTQAAADEGVEVTVMFTHEWVAAHRSGLDEGSSRKIPSLPDLTLIYVSYIYLIFSHILYM